MAMNLLAFLTMIIFTDLDGTLLDHQTYSFDAARDALAAIKAKGIALIFATSKTAAEVRPLQRAVGIDLPAIVENGAGIAWPARSDGDDDPYLSIRRHIAALPREAAGAFRGFGDMSADEVAEATGLSPEASRLARQRRHSEPGLFTGSLEQRRAFDAFLAEAGLKAVQGGRFLTISAGRTKADCMDEIIEWHGNGETGQRPVTLALGDAPNDVAMLEHADFAFIVRNDAHPALPRLIGEDTGRIRRTREPGPAGWNEAVLSFINLHSTST